MAWLREDADRPLAKRKKGATNRVEKGRVVKSEGRQGPFMSLSKFSVLFGVMTQHTYGRLTCDRVTLSNAMNLQVKTQQPVVHSMLILH